MKKNWTLCMQCLLVQQIPFESFHSCLKFKPGKTTCTLAVSIQYSDLDSRSPQW